MLKKLLNIGVYLIPFYELIARVFPYVDSFSPDTRVAKNEVVLIFSVLAFLMALNNGIGKINKWALFIFGYVILSSHLWWNMPFALNQIQMDSFWKWQPIMICSAMFMLFIAVSGNSWTRSEKELFFKHLLYSSSIMAGYSILQWFGIDQFYNLREFTTHSLPTNPNIVGNLGQPTLCGPLFVIAIPFAIMFKKWWLLAILFAGTIITGSIVSILAVFIAIMSVLMFRFRTLFFVLIGAALLSTIVFRPISDFIERYSSGRSEVWKMSISDWKTTPFHKDNGKKYQFTGVGLGVFPIVFHVKHSMWTQFNEAHNEYIEALYGMGIFGLALILIFIFNTVKTLDNRFIFGSFASITFISFFTLLWHLGVYQWITIVLTGLIYSKQGELT